MKKVFQEFIDFNKGDNLRAALASLMDKDLHLVPDFDVDDESRDIMQEVNDFLNPLGYHLSSALSNKKWLQILDPAAECFTTKHWDESELISLKNMEKYPGVNGFFMASVISPEFKDYNDPLKHVVIIDKQFNIIHEPNRNYQGVIMYPLEHIIGYRGVIYLFLINPI